MLGISFLEKMKNKEREVHEMEDKKLIHNGGLQDVSEVTTVEEITTVVQLILTYYLISLEAGIKIIFISVCSNSIELPEIIPT